MVDFNTTVMNDSCNFEDHQDTSIPRTVQIMAILIVGGLGLFGNILIFVLAFHFTVKTNLHHLIVNMVMADLILIVMNSVFTIPSLLNKNIWDGINETWGTFLCKAKIFIFVTSLLVSLVTLFIITLERYRVVGRTTARSTTYSLKQRLIIIAISWFVSGILSSYSLIYLRLAETDGTRECIMPSTWSLYLFVHFFVLYTLCAIMYGTIFVLSVATFRQLYKRTGIPLNLPEVHRERRRKQMVGAIKMIISSLLLYSCCYIPWGTFQAFILVELYFEYPLLSTEASFCIDWAALNFMLSDFLPLVNSSFSPCIYIIFLSHFRRAAKKLLCNETTKHNTLSYRNSITPVACVNSSGRAPRIENETSGAHPLDKYELKDL